MNRRFSGIQKASELRLSVRVHQGDLFVKVGDKVIDGFMNGHGSPLPFRKRMHTDASNERRYSNVCLATEAQVQGLKRSVDRRGEKRRRTCLCKMLIEGKEIKNEGRVSGACFGDGQPHDVSAVRQ